MSPAKEKTLPAKLVAQVHKALDAKKGDDAIARQFKLTRHQVRKIIAERTVGTALLTLPLDAIEIGDRIRKDYGDVSALARSIDANGLLHPVVVHKTVFGVYELVAGERRLRAWKESKFKHEPIPVRIVDLASIRRGEWAENHERKDFTPSETVDIKRKLEIEFDLSGEAERRKRTGKKAAAEDAGKTRDLVGAFAGKSGYTVEKAEAVVKAAEEDPERFGPLKDQMDKTGKVNGPFKRLQNIRSGDALRAEPPPLPGKGPYRTIVADVPWPADIDGERDVEGRGYYPYKTMTLDDIAAIDVPSIVHPDGCALWFWVTNFHLARGCHVPILEAWGFKGSTMLTWCKEAMRQGQRLRGATEHAILAVRGEVPCLAGRYITWFSPREGDSRREHSGKPAEFFDIVQAVTPASRYAYLFAGRDLPENWDGHGDRIETPVSDYAAAAGPQTRELLDQTERLRTFGDRLGRPEDVP
jgi:N6-adenosine-specific RNA methylase IME4